MTGILLQAAPLLDRATAAASTTTASAAALMRAAGETVPWYEKALRAGLDEMAQFLGTHLVSGLLPAFLIAGAIAIFMAKERIIALMGPKASPWIAYPVASVSGALLTVCSCGVIPIFTGILQQGAGLGPATTFLFASPAINLISLVYTGNLMGPAFLWGRVVAVLFAAVLIGIAMQALFGSRPAMPAVEPVIMVDDDDPQRTGAQDFAFFALLVGIMLTSTGILDPLLANVPLGTSIGLEAETARSVHTLLSKIVLLIPELFLLVWMCRRWFLRSEIKLWLKKSWSLLVMIFPTVMLGIFISGCLAALIRPSDFLDNFDSNTLPANLIASVIGSLSYFGTIVGVNIVDTLSRLGMHNGPAMALLLSGPAVSLPSVLAMMPIMGRKRAAAYLALCIAVSAACGLVFGLAFPKR